MSRVRSGVTVVVTVHVALSDAWGEDCPLRQVHKQGADAAVKAVSKAIASDPRISIGEVKATEMRIIQEGR